MRSTFRVLAAATLLALAFDACAQVPGGGGPPSSGTRGAARPQGTGSQEPAAILPSSSITDLIRQRMMDLEEDLRLTPAQRTLWNAFAKRLGELVNDVTRNRDALRFPKGTATQQFDFLADTARNRLTAVEDIADAGKSLYAALTPDQREIADRRLARLPMPLFTATPADGPPPQGPRGRRDGPDK